MIRHTKTPAFTHVFVLWALRPGPSFLYCERQTLFKVVRKATTWRPPPKSSRMTSSAVRFTVSALHDVLAREPRIDQTSSQSTTSHLRSSRPSHSKPIPNHTTNEKPMYLQVPAPAKQPRRPRTTARRRHQWRKRVLFVASHSQRCWTSGATRNQIYTTTT